MIRKTALLFPFLLLFIAQLVSADGFKMYNYRRFVSGEMAMQYDSEFTLPLGRLFSAPACLTLPDLQAGDEIFLVVHDMIRFRETSVNLTPSNDSFMVWTDNRNITSLHRDMYLNTNVRISNSGLQRMFRISPLLPVSRDMISERRTASNFQQSILPSGPAYDYGEGPEDYVVGRKKEVFWVHEDISNPARMYQISATLRAIGQNTKTGGIPEGENYAYAYIFVEDQEWENGHIDTEVVSEIADAFNGENGLYISMTNLLGYEWGGGPAGDGGIDGNKNIYILLHDIQDGFDGSGGFVGGYYYSVNDMETTPLYKAMGVHSNEKQMIVLDTYPSVTDKEDRYPGRTVSVLIHEFQHMIHFNQKTAYDGEWTGNDDVIDKTWLDEACAMLCEDIFKDYVSDPEYYVFNERIPYYLMNSSWPLDFWPDDSIMEDALKSYATAYSFLAYLARNLSPLILKEIVTGEGREAIGIDSVALAIDALGEKEDIENIIKRWREAIIYDDATVPWHGYPYASDGEYELSELKLFDILAASGNFGTTPVYGSIPRRPATRKVTGGYTSKIFAGKVLSDGDVRIYLKNGVGVSHLEYKVIKK